MRPYNILTAPSCGHNPVDKYNGALIDYCLVHTLITEGPQNMLLDAVITNDGDTIPESTEASFLSTSHYYSNSNGTDQFVIF